LNIAGYELIEQVGTGGMASVWKARQLSLDRIVAIKILGHASLPDQNALERFKSEAQIAAQLNHPAIVQIYDAGETGGAAYLVMEFVDGHTLADEILQHNGVSEARALEIAATVARALAYAWEKECLIHCDIKPDNILIDRNSGAIKVADMGLARMIGPLQRHEEDHIFGTPNYMSPEQAEGVADLDCRTDMYALGATLYHMVTGVLPFRDAGDHAAGRNATFLEDPQIVNPALTTPVAWLIEKLMVRNRAARPHFWTQVLKDFEQVRQGLMPFDPLPEAAASAIRRAATRRAASGQKSEPLKKAAPASRLKISRTDMAAAAKTPAPVAKRRSRIAEFMISLLVISSTGLAVLYFNGKLDLARVPGLASALDAARAMFPGETAEATVDPAADREQPDAEAGSEPAQAAVIPPVAIKWDSADFKEGAQLYNEALALYTQYQQTRENAEDMAVIEQKCREAIERFERCRSTAPAHVPIDSYVSQCYGLISGIRQTMNVGHYEGSTENQKDADSPPTPKITIVQSFDKPAITSPVEPEVVPAPEPVPTQEAPPKPAAKLVAVMLDAAWQDTPLDTAGLGSELSSMLAQFVKPAASASVDDSIVLYPGIKAMMTAFEASRVLAQPLPIKRAIHVPGFPANSFYFYEFDGAFAGANRLVLVVDRSNRVLMVQLTDDRTDNSRKVNAPASSRWRVVDFLRARQRTSGNEVILHSARMRNQLVVVDTEVLVPSAASSSERETRFRAQLAIPAPVAGLIVQASR